MSNLPELLREAEAVLTLVGVVERLVHLGRRLMPSGTGRHRRPRR